MTNFIPIFPLGIVVYPGEQLNLHIFEPRYRQLISECQAGGKPFGIPSVINDRICEMGTLVRIREISEVYEDGKMDIKTEGLQVFRMLEMINSLPDKLYSGAIVSYPENNEQGNRSLMQGIVAGIKELHKLLQVEKKFPKPEEELWSYDVAHHAGLSLQEEYELLQLMQELQRQEYLKRHLRKVIPVLAEMEALKEKVKLNGHFKNLKGF
ncbi:MAG TPA: LON peptidase substrate-binding domain-containing protein [Ferruginibacter sp.]|nr:LON peptidase substrate-binding domain-containing protein [Ferruginibacter sp.]MBN8698550.1 LON peptidase substrate-binding domain-containing protein [Chitinophagales bacterium]HMU71110.1 LON peptidase substrate-binding domain-containing protein [Ferruginibacter sp.]HMX37034.1 LON peptidase substrate-binding domain-containing protein [Ferruginibacter sp.]HNA00299.1 LON peptidase substrate-binding domain-containing protein [Ferruginibacter sp.]